MNIEPHKRKLVCVKDDFLNNLRHNSQTDYEMFLNPDLATKVVRIEELEESFSGLDSIIDPSLVRPGAVLLRPKYFKTFAPAERIDDDMVLRKFSLLVQICVALGAKRVDIESEEETIKRISENSAFGGAGQIHTPIAGGGASARMREDSASRKDERSRMSLNTEASGGEANLKAAEKILSENDLMSDTIFESIYRMREIASNRLDRLEINLDFSRDIETMLTSEMKAMVDIMHKFYAANASLERIKGLIESSQSATKLKILVEF